jgi:hypothetical protein
MPPALSEGDAKAGIGRVRLARSPRGLSRRVRLPRRGYPSWMGVDRPALPADSVPPVEHRGCGRRPTRSIGMCNFGEEANEFQDTTGERRQLHCFLFGKIHDASGWRRGVGRQARQSGGRIVLLLKRLLRSCILKSVQVSGTRSVRLLGKDEDYRTARCSIARTRTFGVRVGLPSDLTWAPTSPSYRPFGSTVIGIRHRAPRPSGTPRHHDLAQGLSYSSWRRHQ